MATTRSVAHAHDRHPGGCVTRLCLLAAVIDRWQASKEGSHEPPHAVLCHLEPSDRAGHSAAGRAAPSPRRCPWGHLAPRPARGGGSARYRGIAACRLCSTARHLWLPLVWVSWPRLASAPSWALEASRPRATSWRAASSLSRTAASRRRMLRAPPAGGEQAGAAGGCHHFP